MAASLEIVRFYVPPSASEPMDVVVEHSGLRMVLVNRESIRLLGNEWKVPGVYFLLGPGADPDHFRAYVGEVGRATLWQRIRHHATQKEWWSRALLIASASSFHSAEIGWLEGRLYDVLNNAVACEKVMNGNRPGDESLPARERGVLERYVEPIMAALRACGAPPDTADQKPPPKGRKPKRYSETVSDLIAAGLLKPDTQLHPLRKGVATTATVRADGQLEVDGQAHGSLSGAAKAAAGTIAEAGWDFWGAPSGRGGFIPLAELRARLREGQPAESASQTEAVAEEGPPSVTVEAPAMEAGKKRTPRRFPGTVKQLIEADLLEPGTALRPARRTIDKRATVADDGAVVLDGVTHKTPSAAAKAASGQQAEAGWDFWLIEDERGGTLAQRRAALSAS